MGKSRKVPEDLMGTILSEIAGPPGGERDSLESVEPDTAPPAERRRRNLLGGSAVAGGHHVQPIQTGRQRAGQASARPAASGGYSHLQLRDRRGGAQDRHRRRAEAEKRE